MKNVTIMFVIVLMAITCWMVQPAQAQASGKLTYLDFTAGLKAMLWDTTALTRKTSGIRYFNNAVYFTKYTNPVGDSAIIFLGDANLMFQPKPTKLWNLGAMLYRFNHIWGSILHVDSAMIGGITRVDSSIVPNDDLAYDLGDGSHWFRTVYGGGGIFADSIDLQGKMFRFYNFKQWPVVRDSFATNATFDTLVLTGLVTAASVWSVQIVYDDTSGTVYANPLTAKRAGDDNHLEVLRKAADKALANRYWVRRVDN